jgi:hypothetical protein
VKFVLKRDDAYLQDAFIQVGEEEKATSTLGMASFSGLKVDSCYEWSIKYEDILLLDSVLCITTDTTIRMEFNTTGVWPYATEAGIAIYPNPARDQIYFYGITQPTRYSIITTSGRHIQRGQLDPDNGIDISSVRPGSYILELGDLTRLFFIKTK